MKTYEIKRVNETFSWDTVPAIALENRYYDTPEDVSVTARVAYSDSAMHVYLRTVESSHRAEERGPLGEPYHDSCLEIFFTPSEDDPRYFNFELNSNKCLYLGIRNAKENNARIVVDAESRFSPEVKFNSDGWEIKFRIPYSFIRIFCPEFDPKPGMRIRANCFKCADKMSPEQYLSWSPVTLEGGFTFHKPECFGIMSFGE